MISTLDPTAPEAEAVINFQLRELERKHGLGDADLEDLGQEMRLHGWIKRGAYKPGVAKPSTYMAVIARNRASSVLRDQRAKIRGGGVAPAELDSPEARQQDDRARLRRLGQSQRTAEDGRSLELDVQSVLESLPPELRRLCQAALRPGGSARINSEQNQPALRRIRAHFVAAGLLAYIECGADEDDWRDDGGQCSAAAGEEVGG